MGTMRIGFPQVHLLQHEMQGALSELESATTLNELLQLSERVSHIFDKAGTEQTKKVQHTAQNVFQKSGMEALEQQKESFFQKAEEMEKRGVLKDLSLLRKIQEISLEVDSIDLQFPLLSPEQMAVEIQELAEQLKEVSQRESYNEGLVDALVLHALEKIRHLQFRVDFPIVEELCEHSYQSNFARKLNQCAQDLSEGRNDSFLLLSQKQQKEIHQIARKDSCLGLAKAAQQYLRSLQLVCHLAESFLYGDPKKAVACFQRLDEETRRAIDQILFSKSGQLFETLKKELKEGNEQLSCFFATAIMDHLSDRILE